MGSLNEKIKYIYAIEDQLKNTGLPNKDFRNCQQSAKKLFLNQKVYIQHTSDVGFHLFLTFSEQIKKMK